MTKYLIFAKISFQSNFTYKADYILSIFFNMVFFFIFFAVWRYVYSDMPNGTIATFSLTSTITYYFITSLIYRTDVADSIYIGNDIWNGFFTNTLLKPWSIIFSEILYSITDTITTLALYLPFFALMFVLAHNFIALPSILYLLYFIITLILAYFINIWINFCLHALTFYWGDQEPNIGLVNYIIAFFAGGYFPLAFLPASLAWFKYLPFRFLFDVPANIFLQKLNFIQILSSWGQMIIWIFVFYLIFYFLFKNGLKRYTGTGR